MNEKILVIDDEELVVKSLEKLLKKSGYNVSIAKDGIEGIEKIKKENFNLIVSDIRMPDMDGIEVIKTIREHYRQEGKAAIPEIIITGYASKEKFEEVKKLDVYDYIYKPFDVKEFLEVIKRSLE